MDFQGVILSLLFGFLPMFAFAYVIYWTDRYEKEPVKLLGGAFLWGAIIAAGAAFIVNSTIGLGVYLFSGSQVFTEFSTASTIAPIIEESLKGLACLLIFLFFRREFDSILDGIVYAAITAIGFAATENVYYLYTYGYQETGLNGILEVSFIRVILVGWQHPFYTSFIGIGLAISRLSRNSVIKISAPVLGWIIAVAAHSFHNIIATLSQNTAGFLIGIFFHWSGWIAMGIFILWALYREQRWIITQLSEEVAEGIITPAQYKTACSAWAQSIARIKALISRQYRLTDRFYSTTAELAYKKHQVSALGESGKYVSEITQLRSELGVLSPQISA